MSVFAGKKPYLAIVFLWDNSSSATYVKNKKLFGENIGLPVVVFGQSHDPQYSKEQVKSDQDVVIYINQTYDTIFKVMELIDYLNYDPDCIGILVQLPLPDSFVPYKEKILTAITPDKDVDGLGGVITGLSYAGLIDFVPATARAVLYLLEYYGLDVLTGKNIVILWQSNVVGKPLVLECIKRWATVCTCNEHTPLSSVIAMTKQADYIFSCTGKVHLIDWEFVRDDKTQVVIDVGYGHVDGKPVWDVKSSEIAGKVAAYSPVPGWVWPLTVACIFANILSLQEHKEVLKPYKL